MKIFNTTKSYWISGLWSFCEATFFFIIPDVWLSFTSMESLRKGFKNILFAVVGALVGGTVMYFLGRNDIASIENFLVKVPDINPDIMSYAKESLESEGFAAPLKGQIKRVPYKIYASYYGALSMSYVLFILISIPARLMRFLITIFLSNLVFRVLLKNVSMKTKKVLLVVIWILIYIIYFNSI